MAGWVPKEKTVVSEFGGYSYSKRSVRQPASRVESVPKLMRSALPPRIAMLNRYGIGYPALFAAVRTAEQTGQLPIEVLLQNGTISREIWLQSQRQFNLQYNPNFNATLRRKLLLNATDGLWQRLPQFSSAFTFTMPQMAALAVLFGSLVVGFVAESRISMQIVFALLTIFYFCNSLLRTFLLANYQAKPPANSKATMNCNDILPVYTVLIALYQEANQVERLLKNLSKLDWPKHLLEIKLICEADDIETIEALDKTRIPPYVEVLLVPASHPRTKPKALNFALPLCTGEFLVLYDAEDEPHPQQLREAYARFKAADEKLACLQAPLKIHNITQSWLSLMFAIEYATLFQGILPVLASWRMPIPLGGTSNHFRLDSLRKAGGWDPHNVTEDADLGIRLFRNGYYIETLTLPTLEEAPPHFLPWLRQRTRWMKGWMQTILVHTRNPVKLHSDLGLTNSLMFHLLLSCVVISALIHPFFMALAASYLVFGESDLSDNMGHIFMGVSFFNLAAGYTTYALFSCAVLGTHGQKSRRGALFLLPIYWLAISLAAWRALLHLITQPHSWEKTPHGFSDGLENNIKS